MPFPYDTDTDEAAVAESETATQKPPLYKVLLHNDDFTTMDFVVFVLESIFHRSPEEAMRLMLQVHLQGAGVAGVFPLEIAEMKASETIELARANEFPLLCTVEEAEGS